MGAYVYGVVAVPAAAPAVAGVDGRAVAAVECGELAALVSDCPATPVRANRRNLLAHTQVLQAVAAERGVLPLQFGVVMPGEAAVREELLARHREQLTAELDALAPYVELDLRVLCPEESLLRTVVGERPDIRALRESVAGRPPELSYGERIRLGELVAQATAAKREDVERRVLTELEPLAAATARGEALNEQVLANVAFLVDRARVGEFDAAVDRLGEALSDPIRLRYVGPLAPHRFVEATGWD